MKLRNMAGVGLGAALASIGMPVLSAEAPRAHGQIALANSALFTEAYFNEPATNFALGWRSPTNIEDTLNFLAPPIQVPRNFTYFEWVNAEQLQVDADVQRIRSIGGDFKRVEYTSVKTAASVDNKGLVVRIDLDQIVQIPDWENRYVALLQDRLLRGELKDAVALVVAGATNTAKTWDTTAGKDPDKDVQTDLIAGATGSGLRPNRVLYGDTAWDKRAISHRAQNSAGGFASATLTPDTVASILGVEKTMVSRERYQSGTATKAEVVNNLVIEFIATANPTEFDPMNLARFWTPTLSGGQWRVYIQPVTSKLVDISVEWNSTPKTLTTLGLRTLTIS
jgi:nucleoid-associated protein YgaU